MTVTTLALTIWAKQAEMQASPKASMRTDDDSLSTLGSWLSSTWSDGDFWRSMLVAFLAIFVPALASWYISRTRTRAKRERERSVQDEVFFQGVFENLILIDRARTILKDGSGPETRLGTDIFNQSSIVPTLKTRKDGETVYRSLRDARFAAHDVNQLLDRLQDVERMNLVAVQLTGTLDRQHPTDRYIALLLGDGTDDEGRLSRATRVHLDALRALNPERDVEAELTNYLVS